MVDIEKTRKLQYKVMQDIAAGALIPMMRIGDELGLFKKLNEFADLSSDELIGGFDEIKGKKIRIEGYLEEFSLSRKEADELIMSAREIVYK